MFPIHSTLGNGEKSDIFTVYCFRDTAPDTHFLSLSLITEASQSSIYCRRNVERLFPTLWTLKNEERSLHLRLHSKRAYLPLPTISESPSIFYVSEVITETSQLTHYSGGNVERLLQVLSIFGKGVNSSSFTVYCHLFLHSQFTSLVYH